MKLKHFTTLIAMMAMLGFAMAGCGEDDADADETTTADNPPDDTADEPADDTADEEEEAPAEEETAEADDSVCGQAQACCEAYVEAMTALTPGLDVAATCGSIASVAGTPAGDSTCQTMIDGWRTSLEALPNVDSPEACAAPAE